MHTPPDLAAVGMITSGAKLPWRRRVRETIGVPQGVALRFVIGSVPPGAAASALEREAARHADLVRLDTPDAAGALECSCAEKLVLWFRFALRAFPRVLFIGKTEDDTYVQVQRGTARSVLS